MEYKVVNLPKMKFIGFSKEFMMENFYQEIPKFWAYFLDEYANNVYRGNEARSELDKAIIDNGIGEYGICIDDLGSTKFKYLIAGKYNGGVVPEGLIVYEFSESEWIIFDCIGPIPEVLQSLNTKIFKEWLPNNIEYELSINCTVEWYDNGDTNDSNYHSAIWIPVKRK